IVVSRDLCPTQCWTVRTSKPRRSILVAYVDRKVFRSNSSGSRPARSAISLQRRRKFCSRFPVGDGKRTGCQSIRDGVPTTPPIRPESALRLLPTASGRIFIWFGEDADGPQLRIEILPEQAHHFLLPE